MSSQTTNLNLTKPAYGESADIGVYNDNMDIIDTAVGDANTAINGKAAKGDAIKNITRNGTTFTATKADNSTFTFTQQDTVYTLPLAASGTRGGVQLGYSSSGKNYAVQQSGEKLYVNVPWTDTNTWRGIQNNLTSDSTTDSLSAAQGKALNNTKQAKFKTGSVTGNILHGRLITNIYNIHIIYASASNGAAVIPHKAGDGNWRFTFLLPYSNDGNATLVTSGNNVTVNYVYFE